MLLEPGRFRYLGDACSFDLRPEQIENLEIRTRKTISGVFPRLFVTWRPAPGEDPQVMNLEVREAHSFRELWERTEHLARELEAWRLNPVPLAEPAIGTPPLEANIPGAPIPPVAAMNWKGFLVLVLAACVMGGLVGVFSGMAGKTGGPSAGGTFNSVSVFTAVLLLNLGATWYQKWKKKQTPGS